MDTIRTQIQSKLSEITTIKSGVPIPDGLVEDSTTYFGYELMETYLNSDLNGYYKMRIDLTGRIVRKVSQSENTLQVIDTALEDIKTKLKSLNFKYSYNDISLEKDIRKILVKANVEYYEKNNELLK